MYTYYINLDLNTNTPFVLKGAKQGDRDSRTIIATILEDGQIYTIPENTSASYRIRRPDGAGNWGNATINEDGKIEFTLTSYDLAVSGRANGDVVLTNGTSIIGTCSFIIDIQPAPSIGQNASNSEAFKYLLSIVDAALEMINSAEAWAVGTRNGVPVSGEHSDKYTIIKSSEGFSADINNINKFKQNAIPSIEETFIYTYKYDGTTHKWFNTYNNQEVVLNDLGIRVALVGVDGVINDQDYITIIFETIDPTYKNNSKYYANMLSNAKVGTVTNIPAAQPSVAVVWDKISDSIQFNFNIPQYCTTGTPGRGISNVECTDSQYLRFTYTDGDQTTVGPFIIVDVTGDDTIYVNQGE